MEFRKIMHIDMDAFFASVEQRDNPSLRGIPIAIGSPEKRGVVATASYEARPFGVRSAMSSRRALQLCPQLVFVRPRFDVYKQVSAQMHEIFHEYSDIIEPISLDEAFIDVTVNKPGITLAVDIAREIKQKIRKRLNLTASAGISYNKFLAKIASDIRKPDGICTIHPSQALDYIATLPVERFWGVGPATAAKMHAMGIYTGLDLRNCPLEILLHTFGKSAIIYHNFSLGIDNRSVEPQRIRKSVGCESTLATDLTSTREIIEVIEELSYDLARRLEKASFTGHTFTLKIKHSDFTQHTRSETADTPSWTRARIVETAVRLLSNFDTTRNPVRLIGLTLSNPPAPAHSSAHLPASHPAPIPPAPIPPASIPSLPTYLNPPPSTFNPPSTEGRQLLINFDAAY